MATKRKFTLGPFAVRLASSAFLVFATYNPTEYSYYHWAINPHGGAPALKVVVGLAMILLYAAILRVVVAAFRPSGLILGVAAGVFLSSAVGIVRLPDADYRFWRAWWMPWS